GPDRADDPDRRARRGPGVGPAPGRGGAGNGGRVRLGVVGPRLLAAGPHAVSVAGGRGPQPPFPLSSASPGRARRLFLPPPPPPRGRVACLTVGIPAYFGNRTVVNLDGLVNHAVGPYWRRHEFFEYLSASHLEYVEDEDSALGRATAFSTHTLKLAALASFP